MSIDQLTSRIVSYFQNLPSQGFYRLRKALNQKDARGVYVFESSVDDTKRLESAVREENSLAPIIEKLRFYEASSDRALQIGEHIADPMFADAINTHSVSETVILCAWIYNGDDAATHVREADDFGVTWAAVTFK